MVEVYNLCLFVFNREVYLMATEEVVRDFLSKPELKVIFNRDKLMEESAILKRKVPLDIISKVTDLSVLEIEKIK